jgi:hypothetical protein
LRGTAKKDLQRSMVFKDYDFEISGPLIVGDQVDITYEAFYKLMNDFDESDEFDEDYWQKKFPARADTTLRKLNVFVPSDNKKFFMQELHVEMITYSENENGKRIENSETLARFVHNVTSDYKVQANPTLHSLKVDGSGLTEFAKLNVTDMNPADFGAASKTKEVDTITKTMNNARSFVRHFYKKRFWSIVVVVVLFLVYFVSKLRRRK